jgi:hypothetical protein
MIGDEGHLGCGVGHWFLAVSHVSSTEVEGQVLMLLSTVDEMADRRWPTPPSWCIHGSARNLS